MRRVELWVLAVFAISCGSDSREAPPSIAAGETVCASCGMTVRDLQYAAAVRESGTVRAFDAIECLLRDLRSRGGTVPADTWLADFSSKTLHRAATMTVVAAGYPSPMGGGYAAYQDGAEAQAAAASRGGVAGSLEDFATGRLTAPSR
jgi:hypothetical protein